MVKFAFLIATALFASSVFALPVDVYQRSFELSTGSDLSAREYLAQALATREEETHYERSIEDIEDGLFLRSFCEFEENIYARDGNAQAHLSKKTREAIQRIAERVKSFIPGLKAHQQQQH